MSRAGVLTIDPSLEHARFIEEALAEAQQTRATALAFSSFHLQDVEDAIAVLRQDPYDAVLFGTGIWKWGWETYTRKRKIYRRTHERHVIESPSGGRP